MGPGYKPGSVIARAFFDDKRLWPIFPNHTGWSRGIANLLDERWNVVGVTNELFDMHPYDLPRAWAISFAGAGWDGIKSRLRHLLSSERYGVSVFGATGPTGRDPRFEAPHALALDALKIVSFSDQTGIRVEASPVAAATLHVLS